MSAFAQELAQDLTARVEGFLAWRQRLLPDAARYRQANGPLWGVAFALILLAGLCPLFFGPKQVLLVQQSLTLGLLALSLNILVATTGLITFGHAMFFAFGAYMVAIPFVKHGWSPLYNLALTPVIGAVGAFVIGFIVFRGRELYFSLLTLGVGQLIWAVVHGWQGLTGGTNGATGVFGPSWLSPFDAAHNLFWFIFGCALFCTAVMYVITRSPFGDALRAIRDNRRRAEFTGLWVKRYELMAFVIAGMFGSIAGGLHVIGESSIGSDSVDWRQSALALIVALIGGMRYFLGPFAGAIFWLFFSDYIVQKSDYWDTVLGVLVLIVALVMPGGLCGVIHLIVAYATGLYKRLRGQVEAPVAALAAVVDGHEIVHLPELADVPAAAVASANGAGPPVLEVKGVSKRFGGLVAVNDVTLSVRKGAIHAIIGPNGAGKTTLFNLITGLMKPDGGQVVLEGEDVTGKAPWRIVKKGMGRSFQQTNLFWTLSSLDNVTVAGAAVDDSTQKMWGGHSAGVVARGRQLLDRMGLGSFADVPAAQLSHGDQRSLEIATALAVESRLLLLDEPTAGLSPSETKVAVQLFRRIAREQQLTVLFVEHDMEVVFGIADFITVLHKGALLAEGTPDEIRRNERVREAYLGEETIEAEVG